MRAVLLVVLLAACKQKPSFKDAAPRPPAGDARGTFALTYYWIADGLDATGKPDTAIYDRGCTPIAKVSGKLADELALAGAGKLADGRMVNVHGECECKRSPCFKVLPDDRPWGVGADNRPLVPFRSLAVDRELIPIGTALWIEQLDGVDLPGTFPALHDGCVVADDVGGRIEGAKIDWFVGRRTYYAELHALLELREVNVFEGGERCQ